MCTVSLELLMLFGFGWWVGELLFALKMHFFFGEPGHTLFRKRIELDRDVNGAPSQIPMLQFLTPAPPSPTPGA